MNKKRKNKENLFLDNNKYMKTYSFSLNSKRKCDKIIKEKLQEDSKTLFKKYYKSKNNNENDIRNKNSFNDINNYYLNSQKTLKNFYLNEDNQFGLKIEGNRTLENFSLDEINNYVNNTCSNRESVLRKKLLNYFYPNDNVNKLMGKEMSLTPIPYKKNVFIKTKKEKDDYLKAKKAAVFMRRLEYNYGLKYKNKKNNIKKIEFIQVLKGAVKVIEDWWLKILNRKKKIKLEKELFENNYLTEKDSMSLENIIQNLETQNSESINSIFTDSLIDKWMTSQVKCLLGTKIKNLKENFDKKNLIFLSRNKNNINNFEINKYRKTNNISVFKPNKKETTFKNNNKRYNNFEKKELNNFEKESIGIDINPIKIIDLYNTISLAQNNRKETTITQSDNIHKNFKKIYSKKNKNGQSSKVNFHDLEILQKKSKTINIKGHKERFYSMDTINNSLSQDDSLNQNISSIDYSIHKIKNTKHKNYNRIHKEKIKVFESVKKGNSKINNSNKSKNITSDIEPIKQEEKINIDINNNSILKLQKNLQKKKNNYNVRYNIIKSQNLNENMIFDKSSMDGSVDEIITKKLKEFYDNDTKYSQRINKIYNQVKSSRMLSFDGKSNFNSLKFKNKNFFNSVDND